MHKRTIRLVISAIMLALFVSVPVDAAGQERAELRQRQQRERDRSPRAGSDRRRAVPRDSDRRGSAPRARSDRRGSLRGFEPPARPFTFRRDSFRRDSFRRGSFRRDFGQRGFGRLDFGRRGFRSRFNFNLQLGIPQYYPPYSWERMPYNSECRYRGGRYVRHYHCVNYGG